VRTLSIAKLYMHICHARMTYYHGHSLSCIEV